MTGTWDSSVPKVFLPREPTHCFRRHYVSTTLSYTLLSRLIRKYLGLPIHEIIPPHLWSRTYSCLTILYFYQARKYLEEQITSSLSNLLTDICHFRSECSNSPRIFDVEIRFTVYYFSNKRVVGILLHSIYKLMTTSFHSLRFLPLDQFRRDFGKTPNSIQTWLILGLFPSTSHLHSSRPPLFSKGDLFLVRVYGPSYPEETFWFLVKPTSYFSSLCRTLCV